MLTGEYPFSLDSTGLFGFLEQLPIKPFKVPAKYGISQKFTTLIERMLLYSPFDRIGFEEIVKMPEFALKIPAIFNYKKMDVPITPPPKYIF
jgi:serine/threonine protein kinase